MFVWIIVLATLIPVSILNYDLFLTFNSLHSPISDQLWLAFTTMGDGLMLSIILGSFIILNPRIPAYGITIMLLTSFFVHAIKYAMPTLRPAAVIPDIHIVGPVLKYGSFPSGHAAAAFAACFALVYFTSSNALRFVLIVLAFLIAISRIFVGAHFPIDIVGGLLCALTGFAVFLEYLKPNLMNHLPGTGDLTNVYIKVGITIELIATIFGASFFAISFAESPKTAFAISLTVLLFLFIQFIWLKNNRKAV
jgi:membrane-associated phospholipid phosphatase